jgi:hypothetical protein
MAMTLGPVFLAAFAAFARSDCELRRVVVRVLPEPCQFAVIEGTGTKASGVET